MNQMWIAFIFVLSGLSAQAQYNQPGYSNLFVVGDQVTSENECNKTCDHICAKVCIHWHFDHSHDSTHPLKVCDQWQDVCHSFIE